MPATKMGGKSKIKLLLIGDDDLTNSLLSFSTNEQQSHPRLQNLINHKYSGDFQIDFLQEKGDRSDILLQKIQQIPIPESLQTFNFDPETTFLAQNNTDIIVFSTQPEIQQIVYQHQESGYLISPQQNWEQQWTEEKKEYFSQNFQPTSHLTPEQSQSNYQQIIKYIKNNIEAYIIFYNNSTVVPDDNTHNYYQKEETLSLRLTKLNLALLKLSQEEGISLIDVDQQLAELGAEENLIKALEYTPKAYQMIGQEFMRVMEEVGFFENRPLLVQMGRKRRK